MKPAILAAAVVAGVGFVTGAGSQALETPQCTTEAAATARLADIYGERAFFQWIHPRGILVKMFINPETETMTMLLILPTGCVALMGHGTSFQLIAPIPPNDAESGN